MRLGRSGSSGVNWDRYYATIQLPWDSSLMLGKWLYDWEGEAGLYNDEDAWFTDQVLTGFYWRKNLEKGDITLFAAHNDDNDENAVYTELGDMYNYGARFNFQFNDKFRIAISGLYYDYDNDGTAKLTYDSAGADRLLWDGEDFRWSGSPRVTDTRVKVIEAGKEYKVKLAELGITYSEPGLGQTDIPETSLPISTGESLSYKLPNDVVIDGVTIPKDTVVTLTNADKYSVAVGNPDIIGDEEVTLKFANDVIGYETLPAFESRYYDYGTYWADFGITFAPGFEFKGAYYMQDHDGPNGVSGFDDSPNAYKAIIDVSQDTLKFTSLWVEYAKFDPHFHTALSPWDAYGAELTPNLTMPAVSNVWETEVLFVKLEQKWSDKWATYQRYGQFDNSPEGYARDKGLTGSFDITNWTFGVQYWYTPTVMFELAYDDVDYDEGWTDVDADLKDDSLIRLRTHIFF